MRNLNSPLVDEQNVFTIRKPEAPNLSDGMVLPREMWEHALPSEVIELLKAFAAHTPKKFYIKGGTLNKVVFGGDMVKKGTSPASTRSDIDLAIPEQMLNSLTPEEKEKYGLTQHTIAIKTNLSELPIDILPLESLISQNQKTLEELEMMLNQEPRTKETVTLLKQIAQMKIKLQDHPTFETLMSIEHILPTDELYGEVSMDSSGEPQIVLKDPSNILDETSPTSVKNQLAAQQEIGYFSGIAVDKINSNSINLLILRSLLQLSRSKNTEFTTSIPRHAAATAVRIMKAGCVGDIQLLVEPYELVGTTEATTIYKELYTATKGLLSGEIAFIVQKPNGEAINSKEVLRETVQSTFAEACITNFEEAYNYMALYMPLAGCVCSEFGRFQQEYESVKQQPDTTTVFLFEELRRKRQQIGEVLTPWNEPFESLDTIAQAKAAAFFLMNSDTRQLQASLFISDLTQELHGSNNRQTGNLVFEDTQSNWQNMSQIMAAILCSMEISPQEANTHAQEIEQNWTIRDKTKTGWNRHNISFDPRVNSTKIIEYMNEYIETSAYRRLTKGNEKLRARKALLQESLES